MYTMHLEGMNVMLTGQFQVVAVPISFSVKISCGAGVLPRKHKVCPRSYEELGKPVQLQLLQ